ncbi:MAG: Octanoate-[acyl-carrier-protein]-protein-N-octanoyltransferase, partial [uncultured Propionibacteriaceae bacterium]
CIPAWAASRSTTWWPGICSGGCTPRWRAARSRTQSSFWNIPPSTPPA